ncbi:galanin receptor type 1-like [Actinia tenebrosa]|uniref:Galanin receptor type 1-like n=1 Tax=Actinia tenebrosa TaxID=6105 RepID=A0A6P8I8M6_ACTTE|nr:galanin receptor type 1-like [Actinia tenebrosa]XP_031561443.1 galanin receptor type 1-like [Actinia tenebrosa]
MSSNNTTANITDSDDPYSATLAAADGFFYARLVCYVIIFIVGVIGNVLVCLVVCRQRKMKNITNYFIVNLAVADLSVLLICIPFDFGEIITKYWPYGAVMCKLIYPLQTMATTASVGTLVAISLNRFIAIIYPLRPQPTTRDAKKVIIIVWVLSLVLVSPYIAVLRQREKECSETFQERGMNAGAYTLAIFILQYVLPITLIGLSYIRIGRDLRRDKGSYSNDVLQREQEREAHKVVKILTVVVIVFAMLMLPNHIVFIWIDFGNGSQNIYITQIISLGQILVYFNSATNPLIYNAVNEQFREGFRQYFQSWRDLILTSKGKKSLQHRGQHNTRTTTKCTMCIGSEEEKLHSRRCSERSENDNNNSSSQSRNVNSVTVTDNATSSLLTQV